MIGKKLENLIDVFVWDMQDSIEAATDDYCYDELIRNSFGSKNPSIDFFANSIYLIQSCPHKNTLIS